jgi:methylglutaconyl-CoA hydratase
MAKKSNVPSALHLSGEVSDLITIPADPSRPDVIAFLTLNRPEAANALSERLIRELLSHLERLKSLGDSCRALVLRGRGKHFCGGGDLQWMKQSGREKRNQADSELISALFHELWALPMPTVAVVQGAAFGGGAGLVACCDWAIAIQGARFCLPEVKVGLVAALILPYLEKKVPPGSLRRLVLTGGMIDAEQARKMGLVEEVVLEEGAEPALLRDLQGILEGNGELQRSFKTLHRTRLEGSEALSKKDRRTFIKILNAAKTSAAGQEGMEAFLAGRSPKWASKIQDDWNLPK